MKKRLGGAMIIGLVSFVFLASAWALAGSGGRSLTCLPDCLERKLFSEKFHLLTITGPAPEGVEIILKVVSPNRDFRLNKAGKGLGFVWLPVSHAEVKNIPGMCVLLSSAKISDILPVEEQKGAGLSLDFHEVRDQARISHQADPPRLDLQDLNREYLDGLIQILKQGKLYDLREGAVKIHRGQFEACLHHPSEAPLGEYRVLCYAVKNGKAELFGEQTFSVRSSGLAAWLSHQAHQNSTIYGFLAALMAVGVGLFVGVIFKKGGGH